jgi:hypothetical protein
VLPGSQICSAMPASRVAAAMEHVMCPAMQAALTKQEGSYCALPAFLVALHRLEFC